MTYKNHFRKRKIGIWSAVLVLLCLLMPDFAFALDESAAVPMDGVSLLSDSREDPNFIMVEKRFVGLTPEEIPAAFRIRVASGRDAYLLDADNTLSKETEADGAVIWTWKIMGVGTGTYSVREENEETAHYSVTKSGGGTVTVKTADMAVSVPVHETTCSHTNWPVRVDGDENVLFAATLTQGGVAVISKMPLSASQRAAVSEAVLKINGPWKTPVYFYSIQEQLQSGTGFELNGATITYDASTQEVMIGKTRNWQHVATLTYSLSEADNPEIALVNTYQRAATEVTVSKSVRGCMGDPDKSFAFTVGVKLNSSDASFAINGETYTGRAQFSLKNGESIVLRDVPLGAAVTVTEADYSQSGYAASYAINGQASTGGSAAELTVMQASGNTIRFTNTKDVVPDTGLTLDEHPYDWLLGMVTVGAAVALLRRKIMR